MGAIGVRIRITIGITIGVRIRIGIGITIRDQNFNRLNQAPFGLMRRSVVWSGVKSEEGWRPFWGAWLIL